MTPQELFDTLVAEHVGRPGVVFGRAFSGQVLRRDGKIYAMLVRDRLVVKVPAAQAAELVGSRRGEPFESSPGRKMREWVAVAPPEGDDLEPWRALMDDASDYATAAGGRR